MLSEGPGDVNITPGGLGDGPEGTSPLPTIAALADRANTTKCRIRVHFAVGDKNGRFAAVAIHTGRSGFVWP